MEGSLSWTFLWQHLPESSLTANAPWLGLIPVGVAFLIWRGVRARWPRSAITLRCTAWCALLAALAGVAVRVPLPKEPLAVVVAVDRSASMDRSARQWQERYVAEFARHLAPQDALAVLLFAGNAVVLQQPGPPRSVRWQEVELEADATDLALAVRKAAELFPAHHERRLLLLTDGHENRSEVLAETALLRTLQIPVFPVAPPYQAPSGPRLRQLSVSPSLHARSPASLYVTVEHPGPGELQVPLQLRFNGQVAEERRVILEPGRNVFSLEWLPPAPGAHQWQARLLGAGGAAASEKVEMVSVAGPLRVLVVSARARSLLAHVWREHGVEVVERTPATLARESIAWDSLHAVVLEDVQGAELSGPVLAAVRQFAEQGGGMLVIGNQRTFSDPVLKRSPLAQVLPVSIEAQPPPRLERAPLSLFLVLDRSNSMAYHVRRRLERSDSESKLAYAKRAALTLIDQLRDTDSVGVIAFDSQMYEVAPLRPLAENRAWLEANIPRIVPGGGTDFYDALEHARRALVAARAVVPYVILLTDGDTNRAALEHDPLIEALVQAGVRVTTIRIGEDTVNLALLQSISQRTGGSFYHVEDTSRLPELLLSDAARAIQQSARQTIRYLPQASSPSQVLRGIRVEELPELTSYARTRPKAGARLVLSVPSDEQPAPLLAVWNYGVGRVAAFTASFRDGAEQWVRWPQFGRFCNQLLRWVARERAPADVLVRVTRSGTQPAIELETSAEWSVEDVRGRLDTAFETIDLVFLAGKPRVRTATVPVATEGMAELTVWFRKKGGSEERRFAVFLPPGGRSEGGEEVRPPNRELLEALAKGTGGEVDAPISRIVARSAGDRWWIVSLHWLWLPVALFAFVADVLLRRAALG